MRHISSRLRLSEQILKMAQEHTLTYEEVTKHDTE
eukprot:SAG11_NODE_37511_length_256_cov_1.312102_1_plen_34_part_10